MADASNNRVLIWNAIPTLYEPANVVVGQGSMTVGNPGTTSSNLSNPKGVYSDGTNLFVADQANNRILVWNPIPTANGAAAGAVLGQPNMTSVR